MRTRKSEPCEDVQAYRWRLWFNQCMPNMRARKGIQVTRPPPELSRDSSGFTLSYSMNSTSVKRRRGSPARNREKRVRERCQSSARGAISLQNSQVHNMLFSFEWRRAERAQPDSSLRMR